ERESTNECLRSDYRLVRMAIQGSLCDLGSIRNLHNLSGETPGFDSAAPCEVGASGAATMCRGGLMMRRNQPIKADRSAGEGTADRCEGFPVNSRRRPPKRGELERCENWVGQHSWRCLQPCRLMPTSAAPPDAHRSRPRARPAVRWQLRRAPRRPSHERSTG